MKKQMKMNIEEESISSQAVQELLENENDSKETEDKQTISKCKKQREQVKSKFKSNEESQCTNYYSTFSESYSGIEIVYVSKEDETDNSERIQLMS